MRCALFIGLFLIAAALAASCRGNSVDSWQFGTHKSPVEAAGFHLTVWAPKSVDEENATLPMFLFVTGFGGASDASIYSDWMCELASKGIIAVGADVKGPTSNGVPNYPKLGALLASKTVRFLSSNEFTSTFAQHGCSMPSATQLAMGGHSAGNHVAVQALVDRCGPAKAGTCMCSISVCVGMRVGV
jgi:hypothetical protein